LDTDNLNYCVLSVTALYAYVRYNNIKNSYFLREKWKQFNVAYSISEHFLYIYILNVDIKVN